MEASDRQPFEQELTMQALNPLAAAYQNCLVAREPAERFASFGYLHEVILKSLAARMMGRVRLLELSTPELTTFLRNEFQQPSAGHWTQLLAQSLKILIQAGDRSAQFLQGLLRKKLRDESVLALDNEITRLLGHTQNDKRHVTLNELLGSLIEMRNKTRGHGAPRRAFFEDINPLLDASLLIALETLKPYLWGSLVYIEQLTPQGDNVLVEGLKLTGLTRRPFEILFAPASWLQTGQLFLLEEAQDGGTLLPLDPLLSWDRRGESVGFYNSYSESKQQIEYLSYTRGASWHDRSRRYETAFALPPLTPGRQREAMKTTRLWSNKGVALYPVEFPLVGQNDVFNKLFKFKQAFLGSQADDIAGFFALIGDWGLGKTRIGYELFAQTFNHVEGWVLNKQEFIAPNGGDGRLLQPQLAEGVLPLFIRYEMACDDNLYADNWVARVAVTALNLALQTEKSYDVPPALLQDLQALMRARGVNLEALKQALTQQDDDTASLDAAMAVLSPAGIHHLWVVVDEVETLADLKKGLRDESHEAVREDFLDMVSTVIKHENYRQAHPYVNLLVLCSAGMRDKIEIGPNRRRTDSVELEPNRISDVHTYVDSLRQRAEALGQYVDYPQGTLEGAFIACNRNFGWFNVMMSSIHESYRLRREQGQLVAAWELIEEFGRTESRAKWIFDLSVIHLLGRQEQADATVKRLLFGQLPIPLDASLTTTQAEALQQIKVPGMRSAAFVQLMEVHLDARTLASELVKPEIGFKIDPTRSGDGYIYYNSAISLSSLLAALRAFSVGASNDNFLVCADLAAFTAQLSVLYERPSVDVTQVAEPLHTVFRKYEVADRHHLGPSFEMLQRLDVLLKRDVGTVAFLQDGQKDAALDRHAQEIERSDRKRRMAICQGFARLMDESITADVSTVSQVQSGTAVALQSTFQSPRFDGLRVTPNGRITIVYSQQLEKVAQELGDLIGHEGVHPIVLLLPSGFTADDWHSLSLLSRVALCTLPRALTRAEENFLVKYAGRGAIFQPHDILSVKTQGIRGGMVQNWQRDTESWRDELETSGYLLRPLWHSQRIAVDRFARGYRKMLVENWNIDQLAPDVNSEMDSAIFDDIRKACQYNADPGPGQEALLPIISRDEPYAPQIPPAFGALLLELKSQATVDVLARRFFFAVPEKKMKATKQLEQILELMRAVGLITLHKNAYRAVDAQTLKDYREATSVWLHGECQRLLGALGDTFTHETVERLQKQSQRFAPTDLTQAEAIAQGADFSVLKLGGQTPPESIRSLAQQIAQVEAALSKICPSGVYQQSGAEFNGALNKVNEYEQRLFSLPLWEQVNFLYWLREQYQQKREQLIHAVREQLREAEGLKVIGERPFPIAPLTMPLKTIQQELSATPAMAGRSSRGAVAIPGYPQSFSTYLFMGQFAHAWGRLEKIGYLIERGQPDSFWARFQAARGQWADLLHIYQKASEAWQALDRFMDGAASPAWQGAQAIRAHLEQWQALVEGDLQQIVNANLNQGEEKLIDALVEEVTAAAKYRELPTQVEQIRQAVEAELATIIDTRRLQALGKLLTVKRRSQLAKPALGATYAETRSRYEAFNVQVVTTGRHYFEEAGKQTSWDKWVEIFTALNANQYAMQSEDETALRELEEMRLVERTVKLR
ncbi:MAG: hypothetical protein IPM39_19395 [Chloroflexi bacterium]|nr:hypothetical protein [Chloroflexota bacterium]